MKLQLQKHIKDERSRREAWQRRENNATVTIIVYSITEDQKAERKEKFWEQLFEMVEDVR